MAERPYNVLFLCTGNSARSILSEVILNVRGEGRFAAHSAGSHPTGRVNPLAVDLLQRMGMPTDGLRSKSWDECAAPGAPPLDFVFTVCGDAAGEACPVWTGQPTTAHWAVPDPAAVVGTERQKSDAFREAFRVLERRITLFTSLSIAALDRMTLTARVREIGQC